MRLEGQPGKPGSQSYEHSILRGKINGQPTRELFKPFSQKKLKMDDEKEGSFPNRNHGTLPRLQARTSFLTRTQLTKGENQYSRISLQTVQQVYKGKAFQQNQVRCKGPCC